MNSHPQVLVILPENQGALTSAPMPSGVEHPSEIARVLGLDAD